ncbi:MAG: OmpA family protein [Flammeovirgaceae bacterium]|nr:OmpA family protein [Flammeovirgaceae bacterium]
MKIVSFTLFFLVFSTYKINAQLAPKETERSLNMEMGNFFSMKSGARIVRCSSISPQKYAAEKIINDSLGMNGFWRIANKKNNKPSFPHTAVIELPQKTLITTLRICTHALSEQEYKGVTARTVTIEFSSKNPDEGFEKKLRTFLYKGDVTQVFHIEADSVQWVRIVIENNWDNPNFTEIGRIYGYNDIALNEYKNTLLEEGKLEVHDIRFDENSYQIKNESIPILENIASVIIENNMWKIQIEGHTDSTGSDADNQILSEKRASAVMNKLIEIGVPQEKLVAIGYGESKPLVEETSEAMKAKNRRVTFRVIQH